MASGMAPMFQKREFRQTTSPPSCPIHDSESISTSDWAESCLQQSPHPPNTVSLAGAQDVAAKISWEEPQPWGGRNSINTLDFYSSLPVEDFERLFRRAGQSLWLICQH